MRGCIQFQLTTQRNSQRAGAHKVFVSRRRSAHGTASASRKSSAHGTASALSATQATPAWSASRTWRSGSFGSSVRRWCPARSAWRCLRCGASGLSGACWDSVVVFVLFEEHHTRTKKIS